MAVREGDLNSQIQRCVPLKLCRNRLCLSTSQAVNAHTNTHDPAEVIVLRLEWPLSRSRTNAGLRMQAQGLPSRPNLVRTALENSAAPLGTTPHDALTHGRGLLQVDK